MNGETQTNGGAEWNALVSENVTEQNTSIDWTINEKGEPGFTFNFWIGCTHVSAECANCYAEHDQSTRYKRVEWGKGKPRHLTSEGNRKLPYEWDDKARLAGTRYRVFCSSLSDVMDAEVSQAWWDELFDIIRQTPHLDWLLLTKRPENFKAMLPWERDGSAPWSNVWLGTSIGKIDPKGAALKRLADLQATRVHSVRFISSEPLLDDLGSLDLTGITWVIAGGESGPKARPMRIEWVESLKAECERQGVLFHFKQLGKNPTYAGEALVQIKGAGHDLTMLPSAVLHLAVKNSPQSVVEATPAEPDSTTDAERFKASAEAKLNTIAAKLSEDQRITEAKLRPELIAAWESVRTLECPIFCAVGRVSVAQLFLSSSSRRRGCGEVGSA